MGRAECQAEVRRIARRIGGTITTEQLDVVLSGETLAMERVKAASPKAYAYILNIAGTHRTQLLLRVA